MNFLAQIAASAVGKAVGAIFEGIRNLWRDKRLVELGGQRHAAESLGKSLEIATRANRIAATRTTDSDWWRGVREKYTRDD